MTEKNSKPKDGKPSDAFGYVGFGLFLIALCLFFAVLISLPNYSWENGVLRPVQLLGAAIALGVVGWLCVRKASRG